MQIKKFYATNMPAAMRDIRRALGPDAVILETKTLPANSGVVLRDGRATVEVTAARETPSAPAPMDDRQDLAVARASTSLARETRPVAAADAIRSSSAPPRPRVAVAEDSIFSVRRNLMDKVFDSARAASTALAESPARNQNIAGLLQELRSLREFMRRDDAKKEIPKLGYPAASQTVPVEDPKSQHKDANREICAPGQKDANGEIFTPSQKNANQGIFAPEKKPALPASAKEPAVEKQEIPSPQRSRVFQRPPSTFADSDSQREASSLFSKRPRWGEDETCLPARQLQRRLKDQGVDDILIQRIIERMHFSRENQRMDDRGSFEHLVTVLDGFIPIEEERPLTAAPRAVALIGPTGVGKTTTIAKIASKAALEENQQVALFTLDTYRIAATDQLKTYSKLLGIPLEIITSGSALEEMLRAYQDYDLILIDTPGYSPRDKEAVERLSRIFRLHPDIEINLLISCSTRGQEMRKIMERSEEIGYDRLVFSKMDETAIWGDVLNTWIFGGVSVSYFTTGQRVPEDLEPATLEKLCRRMLLEEMEA